jgi:phosphatidylglycerophosphatase A
MNSIVNKVYAQDNTLSGFLSGKIRSDGGELFRSGQGMGELVSSIISIALPLASFVTVILLVVAGYKMISSQGNPDKLKDAKDMITNAIIGLVFILLSVSILALISSIFNLGVITP